MRAAVVDRYGPPEVVRVAEVPDPVARKGQVLVAVDAVAVTAGDARIRGARFPRGFGPFARLAFGVRRPRRPVLGSALAGRVVAVGDGVTDLAPGDVVAGMNGTAMGGHAELVAARADRLVPVPAGVGADDAAGLLFGGSTALHFLETKGRTAPGDAVLVIGAAGAVGSSAVQIARLLGGEVTGVCSPGNAELVRRLGASEIVDRTRTEPHELDARFDVVLDTVGVLSVAAGRRLLRPGGRLLLAAADLPTTIRARGDASAGPAPERADAFARLLQWRATGDLDAVVTRGFALEEVADAHRQVDTGHKVGNLVLHPTSG